MKINLMYLCVSILLACTRNNTPEHNSNLIVDMPDPYSSFLNNMADEPSKLTYNKLNSYIRKEFLDSICKSESKILWDLGFTLNGDSVGDFEISTFVFDKDNRLIQNAGKFPYVNSKLKKLTKLDFERLRHETSGDYSFMILSKSLCELK